MSKKKITAPLSYDPGKGRPKEYLAYLNWQEMQALQRLNGGNMERGPRGLPSFPPDDAIGSGQTPGSGNLTGSPGGTSVGAGPGGDVGSTTESGNIGGAGTSTSTTSSAASSAASSSAASANTADTAAQQAAAINNAASAARNAALSEDARRAGIGSIEVGPMRTPVNIGSGAISAAVQAGIQQAYSGVSPTMPGGGGMGQLNARRGSLTTAVGPATGVDAFGNIATGSLWGTSPSVARRYDSLENDLARRSLSEAFGAPEEQESYYQNAPSGIYGPRATPSVPSYMKTMSMPGMITTGVPSDYSGTIRQKNTTVAYKTPDPNVTTAYKTPDTSVTDYVPTQFETEVSYTPYRPTIASGTYTTPYNAPSPITADEQRKIDVQYQNMGIDNYANVIAGPKSTEKLKSVFASYGIGETPAENEIANVEEQYREQPNGAVDQYTKLDVAPGEGYITHIDGTPFTAEDIANLPPDIKQEYMDKMRWARMTDEPYPLTTEQKIKVGAVGAITRPITGNPLVRAFTTASDLIGTGLGYLKGPVGEFGEQLKTASERLSKPAQAVADYERLNPLQKAQLAANAGQTYQYGTGTSVAGGTPTQELGGKNYQSPLYIYGSSPYLNKYEADFGGAKKGSSDLRKQYLLWDKGIGIPEPGDPDYNDYMKYLKSRGTSAQV